MTDHGRAGLSEAFRKVLTENGLVAAPTTPEQAEEGIHSWRCGYPDTYGVSPCRCFEELVTDLVDVVAARMADALRDAAEAWYDGDTDSETAVSDWLRDRADEYDGGKPNG